MAPVPVSKRRPIRAKLSSKSGGREPYAPRKAPRPDAGTAPDTFLKSKKDKRLIKHSSFVSRIEKARKKPLKQRRPGKKLVANLDSLKAALPDLPEETMESSPQVGSGKFRMMSLRSRKGALKRKETLVRGEVDRFKGNLARLNAVGGQSTVSGSQMDVPLVVPADGQVEGREGAADEDAQGEAQRSTSSRWAALRGFISSTMEQNAAFVAT